MQDKTKSERSHLVCGNLTNCCPESLAEACTWVNSRMPRLFSVVLKKAEACLGGEVPTDLVINRKRRTLSSGVWRKKTTIVYWKIQTVI